MHVEADQVLRGRQARIHEEAVIVVRRRRVRRYASPGSSVTLGAPRSTPDAGAGVVAVGSPAGAPALSHAANTAISSADSVRASVKSPHPGAGGQGGISPDFVAAAASAA
jgi:hypothetical protein